MLVDSSRDTNRLRALNKGHFAKSYNSGRSRSVLERGSSGTGAGCELFLQRIHPSVSLTSECTEGGPNTSPLSCRSRRRARCPRGA
jgi:hypothetical protein